MNISKAQLKEDKYDAYHNVLHKLARAYCLDSDTDFITMATKECKRYEESMRVYAFLCRNRREIVDEAREMGDRMLTQLEVGD